MFPEPLPELRGSKVLLSRPRASDVEARYAIGRHAEIARAYGVVVDAELPFTREEAERAIAALIEQPHA